MGVWARDAGAGARPNDVRIVSVDVERANTGTASVSLSMVACRVLEAGTLCAYAFMVRIESRE